MGIGSVGIAEKAAAVARPDFKLIGVGSETAGITVSILHRTHAAKFDFEDFPKTEHLFQYNFVPTELNAVAGMATEGMSETEKSARYRDKMRGQSQLPVCREKTGEDGDVWLNARPRCSIWVTRSEKPNAHCTRGASHVCGLLV